jgi:hypothetical protein
MGQSLTDNLHRNAPLREIAAYCQKGRLGKIDQWRILLNAGHLRTTAVRFQGEAVMNCDVLANSAGALVQNVNPIATTVRAHGKATVAIEEAIGRYKVRIRDV